MAGKHQLDGSSKHKTIEQNSGLTIATFDCRKVYGECMRTEATLMLWRWLFSQETMGFTMIWPSNLGKFHGTYGECMVGTCTAEINSVTKIMGIEQLDMGQKPFDTNIALIDGCSSFQIWYDRFWAIPKYVETTWEWWSPWNLVGHDSWLLRGYQW